MKTITDKSLNGILGLYFGESYKIVFTGKTFYTVVNSRGEEVNVPKGCFK